MSHFNRITGEIENIMEERYRIVTVSELAEMLEAKPFGESIDFTFDTILDDTPTGWYGVKIVDLFNEPNGCIAIGYYGGDTTITKCINCEQETVKELLKKMLWKLSETDAPVEVVCVDLLRNNGE